MIAAAVRCIASVALAAAIVLALTMGWRSAAAPADANGPATAAILFSERDDIAAYQRACLDRPCPVTQARRLALATLSREPVAGYPLSVAAAAAARAGQVGAAERLASEGLARDPRQVLARAVRAEARLARRDYPGFLWDMDRIRAIDPERGEAVVTATASIAADPDGLRALEGWIAANPGSSESLVRQLAAMGVDPLTMVRLTRPMPKVQADYLARLIETAGPQAGFVAWIELLPPQASDAISWPYNPTFKDAPGAPPYNWRLLNDQVEMRAGEGLTATYFGKGRQGMADQIMLLSPGRYTFTAHVVGDIAYGGGGFVWTISCLSGNAPGAEIGSAALAPTRSGPGGARVAAGRAAPAPADSPTISFAFTVPPAGCPAQRLSLEGRPGEFPKRAEIQTSWVRISPSVAAAGAAGGRT